MATKSKVLQKLREKEAKLKAEIKEAEKAEAKRQAEIYARRCEIVGAAVLAESEKNATLAGQLQSVIDKHTTKTRERKFLGLPPLKKESQSNGGNDEQQAARA